MANEIKNAVRGDELGIEQIMPYIKSLAGRRRSYGLQNTLMLVLVALFIILVDLFTVISHSLGYLALGTLIVFSVLIYMFLLIFLLTFRGRVAKASRMSEMEVAKQIEVAISRVSVEHKNKEPTEPSLEEKLEEEKVAYIGSIQTKTYHLPSCRLARLIKPEFKLANSTDLFFKRRKFKPCKTCISGKSARRNAKKSKKGKRK